MNKILSFFDGIANYLCGIGSDKYAHLLVSLVATFVLGYIYQAGYAGGLSGGG